MAENKPIIIDGVDVSGCNFTIERDGKIKCECTHATGFGVICDCESWKTCDYKNYKRKEQECKNVQYELIEANKQVIYSAKQLDQLKAENEKLKEFSKLLEEQMKFNKSELELSLSSEIKRSEFLLKEFKKADKQRDNWREKAEKLKQTIAEIKEIALGVRNYLNCPSPKDVRYEMDIILQK